MNKGTEQKSETRLDACIRAMDFFQNWDEWRQSLSEIVLAAREIDSSGTYVAEVMEDVIDFLSERICHDSPEEYIMSELWDHANENERMILARMMLRLFEHDANMP